MRYDIRQVREQFPALKREIDGNRIIYFDNPAGTQVPQRVIDLMTLAMTDYNANLDGFFKTSIDAGELVKSAHEAMADFVNANDPGEIFFGQSMTALTFMMARSLAHEISENDEIVVTRIDHDGNVTPWLMLAEDTGATIKWLDLNPESCELDLSGLSTVITERTKIVAVNYASNISGSITDVKRVTDAAKAVGALTYVDAVQYIPHGVTDVQALGCDMLVCSAYKFYGPHQGIMWAKRDLLERLKAYKVRASANSLPEKFASGTESREALAGIIGALEHYEWVGSAFGGNLEAALTGRNERQANIRSGISEMHDYELTLTTRLIDGLMSINGTKILGIKDKKDFARRVTTVSFTQADHHPDDIAKYMARHAVSIWSGHNYAIEPMRRLALLDEGSVVRVGPTHYNTIEEIDRFLNLYELYLTKAR